MGKSTINGPFSIAMVVYQRVSKTNHPRLYCGDPAWTDKHRDHAHEIECQGRKRRYTSCLTGTKKETI